MSKRKADTKSILDKMLPKQTKSNKSNLKPLKWKKLNKWGVPDFSSIKKGLDSLQKVLNGLLQVIETVRPFVELLRILEMLLQDLWNTVLREIVKTAREFIDDLRNTGVYVLELVTPFWKDKVTSKINVDHEQWIVQQRQDKNILEFTNDLNEILHKEKDEKGNLVEVENKYSWWTGSKEFIWLHDKLAMFATSDYNAFNRYEMHTYEEFMKIITDAFMDEDDNPPIRSLWDNVKLSIPDVKKEADKNNKTSQTDSSLAIDKSKSEIMKVKPWNVGRPDFGPGSEMRVYLLMFEIGDFNSLLVALARLMELFGNFLTFSETFPRFGGYDFGGDLIRKGYSVGKDPNFYGMTFEQLMPPIFRKIDEFLAWLESLTVSGNIGLADLIDWVLDYLEKKVNELLEIIDLIEKIILLIEALLKSNLMFLEIKSSEGVLDVVNQMNMAQGWPDQGTGLKQNIGGMVIAMGWPNPKSDEYSFSKNLQKTLENFDESLREKMGISLSKKGVKVEPEGAGNKAVQNFDAVFKKIFG